MATEARELLSDWESLTSGAENALIQVRNGVIEFCDSDATPGIDAAAHTLDSFITVAPPMKIWARAVTPGKYNEPGYTRIAITKWQG